MGRLDDVSELDRYALQNVLKSKDWSKEELEKLRQFLEIEKNYRLNVSKK